MDLLQNHTLRVEARTNRNDVLCADPALARAELKTLADMIALSLDANDGEEMGDAERSTLYVQIEIAKKALAALIPEAT